MDEIINRLEKYSDKEALNTIIDVSKEVPSVHELQSTTIEKSEHAQKENKQK